MFNPNFNPGQVMFGNNAGKTGPYMNTKPVKGTIAKPSQPQQPPQSSILQSEAVRATGQGPYDPAYRQDLATYAGGQFQKPGGVLNLNPTGPLTGNPTGAGSSPVQGAPTDLLSMALGGQGFNFAAPQPTQPKQSVQPGSWQQWIQGLMGNQNFGNRGRNTP